jgi:protein involved in ribonucleotide reduction
MTAVVYFSSVSNNTSRFVDSCCFHVNTYRIPVKASEPPLHVSEDYVLITPTYGGGRPGNAVPIQVKKFLKDTVNADYMIGVIASGNINFGEAYAHAGDVIAARFHVPFLYRFELMGTPEDHVRVRDGVERFLLDHADHEHQ